MFDRWKVYGNIFKVNKYINNLASFCLLVNLKRNFPEMSQAHDALGKEEEAEFVPEEVQEMAYAIIDKIIGENSYSDMKVTMWTTAIIERLLTDLAKLKRPYKYVVNCVLQQKTGAGFHMAHTCYWDITVDGSCTVKWSNDFVHCCLHVYGVQI